jgi:N-acetylmuramoyl-L-alanine amidase
MRFKWNEVAIALLLLAANLHSQEPRTTVVLDAAHGGDDPGTRLSSETNEKDFTLGLTHQLAIELRNRGINVVELRAGDQSLGADQRAERANQVHPAAFVSVHATDQNVPVRIYTVPLSPTTHRSGFLPWKTAQSAWAENSQRFAAALSASNKDAIEVKTYQARIATLASITAPAVAVEIPKDASRTTVIHWLAEGISQWSAHP